MYVKLKRESTRNQVLQALKCYEEQDCKMYAEKKRRVAKTAVSLHNKMLAESRLFSIYHRKSEKKSDSTMPPILRKIPLVLIKMASVPGRATSAEQ